jgi:hypothetical protein
LIAAVAAVGSLTPLPAVGADEVGVVGAEEAPLDGADDDVAGADEVVPLGELLLPPQAASEAAMDKVITGSRSLRMHRT